MFLVSIYYYIGIKLCNMMERFYGATIFDFDSTKYTNYINDESSRMQSIYNLYQIFTGAYPIVCARCCYDNHLCAVYDNGPEQCSLCMRSSSYISKKSFTNSAVDKIRQTIIPSQPHDTHECLTANECSHCNYDAILKHVADVPYGLRSLTSSTICRDCVMRDSNLMSCPYRPGSMTLPCALCDIPLVTKYTFHTVCMIAYRNRKSCEKKRQ
jgi:hypothetical protein